MFKKKYIHISKINVKMICLLVKMAQLTKLLKSYIACWMLFTMIMFSQPFNCRSFNLWMKCDLLFTLKWESDCCLMPTQQLFSYTMVIFALYCVIHKFMKKYLVSEICFIFFNVSLLTSICCYLLNCLMIDLWCLTPLLTIFKLYHGSC